MISNIMGVILLAWAAWAIATSIMEPRKDPSVGGAAMIVCIMGIFVGIVGLMVILI